MAIIDQRYASAVHSKSLSVDEKTTMSDTDVLGAMGLAARVLEDGRTWDGKPVRPAPLAVPLARLFAGDSNAAHEIVRTLATMAFDQSFAYGIKIAKPMCEDMAKSCLAWHRNGICRRCGGHGLSLIPGTKTLSDRACVHCKGSSKVPFERNFRQEWQPLARWLVVEMRRESSRAGPQAMRSLAATLNL
jgi:hypothetical protein